MSTSEVIYLGDLSTEATHIKSSSTIRTDAPTDNNGLGRTFSPTDLLATSLASCMLTIMGIRANESQLNIKGSKASVAKTMSSKPRKVSGIQIHLEIRDSGLTKTQKRVLEKAALNCPVALSLSKSLKQEITFSYRSETA